MPRDEVQAAYFTLLRARDELESLQRYQEYLRGERERLVASADERQTAAQSIDRRLRRALRPTTELLDKAVEQRLRVIEDELRRLPDRIDAAKRYVEESAQEHEQLKRSA